MKAARDTQSGALVVPREYGEVPSKEFNPLTWQGGELAAGCSAAGAAPATAAPSLSEEEQLKRDHTETNGGEAALSLLSMVNNCPRSWLIDLQHRPPSQPAQDQSQVSIRQLLSHPAILLNIEAIAGKPRD